LRALSDKDKEDVEYVMKHMGDVDYFALSFIRHPQDVLELRELIRKLREERSGGKETGENEERALLSHLPRIIAKIERPECFLNSDENAGEFVDFNSDLYILNK
jgi:pyruvate kinase